MAYDNAYLEECSKRLLKARMRLLAENGFYGMLLSHMIFALDQSCETAATDGERIYFGPEFLKNISDSELEFILMHEILHVALRHCLRTGQRNHRIFNIATDIVVNSNIMHSLGDDGSKITLKEYGESMHIAPNGKEGYLYTAEEVYEQIEKKLENAGISVSGQKGEEGSLGNRGGQSSDGEREGKNIKGGSKGKGKPGAGLFQDDHSKWGKIDKEKAERLRDTWQKRVQDAALVISVLEPSKDCGSLPMCVQRVLKEQKRAQTDWKSLLNAFVQEEICDYSFTPPDRRFADGDFFLPDFNEKDESVKNVLFMVDTSGSVTDKMIAQAYGEIKGALDQFDGKLQGWLGFFDAQVVEPIAFSSIEELEIIRPRGGGGTSFHIIFDYVREQMTLDPPMSIVILTDGYAPFPKESEAQDIPVLWIINNEDVTPPWGKIARITVD